MGHFYQLTIRLLVALTVITSVVQLHRPATPALLSLIFSGVDGSPCKQPCLFGVRPGTPLSEAVTTFNTHPFVRKLKLAWAYRMGARYTGPGVMVALTVDNLRWTDPLLISVMLFPDTKTADPGVHSGSYAINLGDVLNTLGEPDTMYLGFDRVLLLYFGNHLVVSVNNAIRGAARLDADSEVNSISLSAAPAGIKLETKQTHWLGFTTIQRYEQNEN